MGILLSLLPINPRLKVHLHLDTYYMQLDAGQMSTIQIAKRFEKEEKTVFCW